jgi:hypothetical protein
MTVPRRWATLLFVEVGEVRAMTARSLNRTEVADRRCDQRSDPEACRPRPVYASLFFDHRLNVEAA